MLDRGYAALGSLKPLEQLRKDEKSRALRGYMPMDVLMQQLGGEVSSEEQSVEPSH